LTPHGRTVAPTPLGKQNVTLLTIWEVSQAVGVSPASLLEDYSAAS
jgi:hypothetical protein